jgi:peroxiredoxin
MRTCLVLAAVYNLAWGALTVLYPAWLFRLTGMAEPTYPFIWQCVGMIVGVYGIGYWCASRDPLRHWPIVLVGLLGKIFGPIGYAAGLARGEVPAAFGVTLPTNDLVWWIPFTLILWAAARHHSGAGAADADGLTAEQALADTTASDGRTLADHSRETPLLLVFLRHAGCTFCREALADLRDRRSKIESAGVRLAIVHMDPDDAAARAHFAKYNLADALAVSDPTRRLYRALGLGQGRFGQLFGPKAWVRGVSATLRGHRVGKLVGDGFQMPGVFLVEHGRVVSAYRHRSAADRPDYVSIVCARGGA